MAEKITSTILILLGIWFIWKRQEHARETIEWEGRTPGKSKKRERIHSVIYLLGGIIFIFGGIYVIFFK